VKVAAAAAAPPPPAPAKKTAAPRPAPQAPPLVIAPPAAAAPATAEPPRKRRPRPVEAIIPGAIGAEPGDEIPDVSLAALEVITKVKTGKGPRPERKGRKKGAKFDTADGELQGKKKKRRLERLRRAGVFGVPGGPRLKKKKKRMRDEVVRPSPPLEKTEPLKHYLAGEMVPCPVGCGGFSEVVRRSTLPNGGGEVWFECLSCAQRKRFDLPPSTPEERQRIHQQLESGHEPLCPRHTKTVQLRRRGREFICPECGVSFPEL
jgi:hypothetical protein